MNRVLLAGRLVRDPKHYPGSNPMTLFTLGVEQPNDPDEYEHLALVAFGAAAEYAAKAKEDDFLVVEAFARNRRERGEDGTVHRNLELVATRVELTGE